jgi:hypothetical protein
MRGFDDCLGVGRGGWLNWASVGKEGGKSRADLNRPWRLCATRTGLAGLRIHDLRHTHASFGAGAGLGPRIIGKVSGHARVSTTQRYVHLKTDPLRRASDHIGSRLAAAIGELVVKRREGGTVVPLRGAAGSCGRRRPAGAMECWRYVATPAPNRPGRRCR